MDFFQHQDRARASTTRLLVYYGIALLALVAALNVAAAYAWRLTLDRHYDVHSINWPMHATVTLVVCAIVAIATAIKHAQLGDDGANVAEMLGGKAISGTPADLGERRLVNVVEEMALASGVPMPRVYVLPGERGINAFAAGTRIDNAVVGITRGALDGLSRDQLQGVVAHEFSHIFNGDMRRNLRLISLNFGLGAVGQMAIEVVRGMSYSSNGGAYSHGGGGGFPTGGGSHSSGGSSDSGGGGRDAAGAVLAVIAFIILVAIAAAIIGLVGAIIGKVLQAAVSRQREYLADASAVQYTRNPLGIVGALKRIGGFGSKVKAPAAGQASHLFFSGIGGFFDSIFATHPSLAARIRAIEPNFDGQMTPATTPTPQDEPTAADAIAFAPRSRRQNLSPLPLEGERVIADAAFAAHASAPAALADDPESRAAPLSAAIPDAIRAAAREPFEARAVALALLLDRDAGVRDRQYAAIFAVDEQAASLASQFVEPVGAAGPAGRLPILELALPAIRRLSPAQQRSFKALCRTLAAADQHLAPFELTMLRMIDAALPAAAEPRGEAAARYRSVGGVADQAAVLLSVIANAGGPEQARRAFDAGVARLKLTRPVDFTIGYDAGAFERALATLRRATAAVRYRIVDAAAATVSVDGTVRIEEMELMRAACAAFGVPVPPNLRVSRDATIAS